MAATQEKIRRIRGPLGALSPRGAIPADAVRVSHTDRVSRLLGRVALITAAVVVVLFILYKFMLMSGASSLSALAAGLLK
jgi:type VI protein secretion system component VasF